MSTDSAERPDRRSAVEHEAPDKPSLGLAPKIAIGALAVFGAISLLGWVFDRLFGLVKLAIVIVVLVAVVAWVVSSKGER